MKYSLCTRLAHAARAFEGCAYVSDVVSGSPKYFWKTDSLTQVDAIEDSDLMCSEMDATAVVSFIIRTQNL